MSIGHIQLFVSNLAESKKFYLAALEPLGYKQLHFTEGVVVGLGAEGKAPNLWIRQVKNGASPSSHVHVAFEAGNREQVKQFHEEALKTGAKDNGGPGERDFFPGYYAAFAFDPDGNNIEAVHL